jgi:hypothetical protein
MPLNLKEIKMARNVVMYEGLTEAYVSTNQMVSIQMPILYKNLLENIAAEAGFSGISDLIKRVLYVTLPCPENTEEEKAYITDLINDNASIMLRNELLDIRNAKKYARIAVPIINIEKQVTKVLHRNIITEPLTKDEQQLVKEADKMLTDRLLNGNVPTYEDLITAAVIYREELFTQLDTDLVEEGDETIWQILDAWKDQLTAVKDARYKPRPFPVEVVKKHLTTSRQLTHLAGLMESQVFGTEVSPFSVVSSTTQFFPEAKFSLITKNSSQNYALYFNRVKGGYTISFVDEEDNSTIDVIILHNRGDIVENLDSYALAFEDREQFNNAARTIEKIDEGVLSDFRKSMRSALQWLAWNYEWECEIERQEKLR